MGKYYITTTAPYVNSDPHIGFALEIIQADVLARYHESLGEEVFFNTGTDEHGKKIYEKAVEAGREPQEYVDEYAHKFRNLKELLGLAESLRFSRTTDLAHVKAAQEMWKRVEKNGYIRQGTYQAKYCVGCELEKQDSELVEGKCPLHPTQEIEMIDEENYFFCFSKLQKDLLALYDKYPDLVVPAHRQKEIKNFVASGLADFSISRLKEKMPWGIPVPGDESQVMYVWFDALTYYISALGWPSSPEATEGKPTIFEDYWGRVESPRAVQVAGKDNLRQQTAMWQAMLIAAGLPTSRQIMIHGFITSGGQKMSKSLGNVINPVEYVERYGVDALRYYLLAKMDPFEDSDFTQEKFESVYTADLVNGLGNLVSRVAALCEKYGLNFKNEYENEHNVLDDEIAPYLENYQFDQALKIIWGNISGLDSYITKQRPWQQELSEANKTLSNIVIGMTGLSGIRDIAGALRPFMPKTAEKILTHFDQEKIEKMIPLFPRLT